MPVIDLLAQYAFLSEILMNFILIPKFQILKTK